jgi:hypothetical protein
MFIFPPPGAVVAAATSNERAGVDANASTGGIGGGFGRRGGLIVS